MKSIKKYISVLTVLLCTLSVSSISHATLITADSGWYGFCFDDVGSGITAGCQNEGTAGVVENIIEFTLIDSAWLKVTDGFNVGDVFDVLVNSAPAFTTSTPGTGSTLTDPDDLFNSGYYSAGAIFLNSGSYTAEVFVNASPFGGGGGYLELETARQVPEPSTLAIFALGIMGLISRRFRK